MVGRTLGNSCQLHSFLKVPCNVFHLVGRLRLCVHCHTHFVIWDVGQTVHWQAYTFGVLSYSLQSGKFSIKWRALNSIMSIRESGNHCNVKLNKYDCNRMEGGVRPYLHILWLPLYTFFNSAIMPHDLFLNICLLQLWLALKGIGCFDLSVFAWCQACHWFDFVLNNMLLGTFLTHWLLIVPVLSWTSHRSSWE